jgi:hypothetical protein
VTTLSSAGTRSRRRLIVLLVALNTVPFAPVYPGSVYEAPFVVVWVGVFLFASAPFWLAVVVLWWMNRRRTPALRCVIAEMPGLLQAAMFIQYWQAAVLILALRAADGILLHQLARSRPMALPDDTRLRP